MTGTGSSGATGNNGVEMRSNNSILGGSGAIAITGTGAGGSSGTGIVTLGTSGQNTIGGSAFTGDLLLRSTAGTGMSLDATISTAASGGTRNVTLNASGGGSVAQSAPSSIVANGLRLLGDNGATYTLTNAANDVATLAGAVDGAVSYTEANSFTIG